MWNSALEVGSGLRIALLVIDSTACDTVSKDLLATNLRASVGFLFDRV